MNLTESLTMSRPKEIPRQFVDAEKVAANFKLELHHKKYFYKLVNRWQRIDNSVLADPDPSWKILWQDKKKYQKHKRYSTSLTKHKKKRWVDEIKTKGDVTNKLVIRGDAI